MSIRQSITEFMKGKESATFVEIYSFCQKRGSSYPGVYSEVRSMCCNGLMLRSGEPGGYCRDGYHYRLVSDNHRYPLININTAGHNPLVALFDRCLREVRSS